MIPIGMDFIYIQTSLEARRLQDVDDLQEPELCQISTPNMALLVGQL